MPQGHNPANIVKKSLGASQDTWFYGYDHHNRMIWAEKRAADSPTATLLHREEYDYDVFGNRIEVRVDSDGNAAWDQITASAYIGNMAWADLDNGGNLVTRYLLGDRIDQYVARIDAQGNAAWYLADHLGSITDIVNASGSVINHTEYDSFGNITAETGTPYGDRIKYTGREWSAGTGLYYYRARWYDPTTGRFMSEDPSGFPDGPNRWIYVANSPLLRIDPRGLAAQDSPPREGFDPRDPARRRPLDDEKDGWEYLRRRLEENFAANLHKEMFQLYEGKRAAHPKEPLEAIGKFVAPDELEKTLLKALRNTAKDTAADFFSEFANLDLGGFTSELKEGVKSALQLDTTAGKIITYGTAAVAAGAYAFSQDWLSKNVFSDLPSFKMPLPKGTIVEKQFVLPGLPTNPIEGRMQIGGAGGWLNPKDGIINYEPTIKIELEKRGNSLWDLLLPSEFSIGYRFQGPVDPARWFDEDAIHRQHNWTFKFEWRY